jgi:hypothetical protein
MKDKIIAIASLAVVLTAVVLNGLALKGKIEATIEEVASINIQESGTKDEAERIFDNFLKREHYISLTVSHEDLTMIEDCFCEMIGYLKVGDIDNAEVTKGRLLGSLEHLRRLSGFNIDTII